MGSGSRASGSTGGPPVKPAVFHILLALADGDKHGYAVMQAVRESSDGQIPLRTGSFYRHLTRLIDASLVAESTTPRGQDDPRRGAYYRLTAYGHRVLVEERQRLASLVAAVDEITRVSRKRHA